MALELLNGSNYRVRISEDAGSTWKLFDCEKDCTVTLTNAPLDDSCKGEFFDVQGAGRASAQGTINMTVSDTKASSSVIVLSKLLELQISRKIVKFEFTETKDNGDPLAAPKYTRGDGFVSSNSWSFEDHQFVNNSVTIVFTGVVEHS